MRRREFLGVGGLGLTVARRGFAAEQPFRGKRIRWIVPYNVGAGFDIYVRLVEPYLERYTGAEVVVENAPGAGGRLGAARIARSAPDGLTLGLLDAPGMLISAMAGVAGAPQVLDDFTILGRFTRNQHVWATGRNSGQRTIGDLMALGRRKPVLVGVNEIGATHHINAVIGAHLLNMPVRFVPGYGGSRQASLAAVRGEVDAVVFHFESILDLIEDGDLRPLLQVSDRPFADHPSLAAVPLLGGPGGLAERCAAARGTTAEQAGRDAAALVSLVGAGRLFVAPAGMDEATRRYLDEVMGRALTDPEFLASAQKARRSLDIAGADEATADLKAGVEGGLRFIDLIRQALRDARKE